MARILFFCYDGHNQILCLAIVIDYAGNDIGIVTGKCKQVISNICPAMLLTA